MNELRNRERHSQQLPWWRLGPFAIGALLLLMAAISGLENKKTRALRSDRLVISTVNYQAESAPAIQLPDVSSLSGVSASEGQQMEKKLAAANEVISAITPADWLGPLAPIAMSPFFGITCLSGLAMWGPDWMPGNGLLDSVTPLKSPMLFWVFAVLTIVTSLPRLSKLSKPMAQAVDQVEAYAGIITLLVIKYIAAPVESVGESGEVMEAGIVSTSVDAILYVMLVINVLVINSVKFFFEFMIWLTPVPFIDACFEAANKAVCGALMAVYAFSPTLATIINLSMFVICLLVLRWIGRRITQYRTLALDPLFSMLAPSYGKPQSASVIVFPKTDWNGFQDKSRLLLFRDESGLKVRQVRKLSPSIERELSDNVRLEIRKGLLWNRLYLTGDENVEFVFSRRYQSNLSDLAEMLDADINESDAEVTPALT